MKYTLTALALVGLLAAPLIATSTTKALSANNQVFAAQLSSDDCKDLNNCGVIENYVNPAINVLSVVFGIAVVISIVVGGIQYSASAGDPNKVAEARKRISNSILSLVAFIFLYAIIDFLLPGGIIK